MKVVFFFGSPHPRPLPEGEGIPVPDAQIRAEQYWALSREGRGNFILKGNKK
jgi:hypothetical protein